ncbi:MAG: MFS transporter [Acidobacteria bacterium]|nr:MFS transporter [Acidobacteriota bacterium]
MSGDHTRHTLVLVAAAALLSMSPWFSGTVVLPQLERLWQTDIGLSAWLTMAVQLGFVVGGLVSALFNLPDRFSAPRVFVVSSVGAAAVNAVFAAVAADQPYTALVMRFLTGAFLAGVYPPGMKILAGWFRDPAQGGAGGRGTALGVLVGALTVGKALPHGVFAVSDLPWREVVLSSSVLALVGAALVAFGVKEGPYAAPQPPVDFRQIGEVFCNRGSRLANFGYFGHMWELYSMWGWVALLLAASAGTPTHDVAWWAFAAIAAGGVGCVWAGRAADAGEAKTLEARVARRARVTIIAMAVSGACCLLAAVSFQHYWLLVMICLVWGAAVVADSAQFSTIVSEVCDRRYVGTALTVQTAVGFLLTVVSLRVIGAIGTTWGWDWAAASMAIGPALGIVAMWRLQRG